jgi:hypothetical protein
MNKNSISTFTCPCCGFIGLDCRPYENASGVGLIRGIKPPYHTYFGSPSYEVCPCCEFEFGNDDNPGTSSPSSFEKTLADWITRGECWSDPSKRPPGWSLKDQLYAAATQFL